VLFALFRLAALSALADDAVLSVHLTSPSVARSEAVFAVTAAPQAENSKPVTGLARLGGTVRLPLAPGLWTLSAGAQGYWSAPRQLLVRRDGEVTLSLWPATRLEGRLAPAPGVKAPWPRSLAASIQFLDTTSASGYSNTEPCEMDGTRWRCILPAARLDIRMKPEGFAPRYFRQMSLSPSRSTDVGLLVIEPGASVAGRVVDPEGGPVVQARVELRAADGSPLPGSRATTADAAGYFQLSVSTPASYAVWASDGARSAASAPFGLREDDELMLAEPLTLREPLRLSVLLTPPLDDASQPWRLRVFRVEGAEARLVVAEARASRDGEWALAGLEPGTYRIAVSTSSGTLWVSRTVALSPGSETVRIGTAACSLVGTIRLGDRGVAASIVLRGSKGSRIAARSSDDGDFRGPMPCIEDPIAQKWQAEVVAPSVRRSVPDVTPRPDGAGGVTLDLALPDSSVDASVHDEQGAPVDQAVLTVVDVLRPDRMQQAGTPDPERAGHFVLRGLDAGSYSAWARAGNQRSDPVRFEVTKAEPHAEVELVLREQLTVRGMVVGRGGAPVPSAFLRPNPIQSVPPFVKETQTDDSGRFELTLPSGTRQVALAAWAYGMAYTIERVDVSADTPLVVELETEGGTLILEADQPLVSENATYLMRAGSFAGTGTLHAWAALHGKTLRPDSAVFPQMAPGNYRVCRVPMAEIGSLVAGLVPEPRCAGGDLAAGQVLTLRVPSVP
jgi:hypothetical protein